MAGSMSFPLGGISGEIFGTEKPFPIDEIAKSVRPNLFALLITHCTFAMLDYKNTIQPIETVETSEIKACESKLQLKNQLTTAPSSAISVGGSVDFAMAGSISFPLGGISVSDASM